MRRCGCSRGRTRPCRDFLAPVPAARVVSPSALIHDVGAEIAKGLGGERAKDDGGGTRTRIPASGPGMAALYAVHGARTCASSADAASRVAPAPHGLLPCTVPRAAAAVAEPRIAEQPAWSSQRGQPRSPRRDDAHGEARRQGGGRGPGASRGIGADIARLFAAEGGRIVCAARTLREGEHPLAGSLETTGGRHPPGGRRGHRRHREHLGTGRVRGPASGPRARPTGPSTCWSTTPP